MSNKLPAWVYVEASKFVKRLDEELMPPIFFNDENGNRLFHAIIEAIENNTKGEHDDESK